MNKLELDPEASPRARFGVELRLYREQLGMTQVEFGTRLGRSGSLISAVETGSRSPTLQFARRVDQKFDTGNRFAELYWDVQASAMLHGFADYASQEARAVEIRVFEIGIIPGLLQTQAYAETLAAAALARGAITPAQAEERVALVLGRQRIFELVPAPRIYVILDESCIRRPVGDAAIWGDQLDQLVAHAQRPNVTLQVAPFCIGEARSLNLPVYLLALPDRSVAAYSESAQQGFFERDPDAVAPLLSAYHHLQVEALPQAPSVELIRTARKDVHP
ncbi:Scr1 family TA system antitoxin-like transcriptional regulator [Kitasatospora sp. NPDC006697]|uniref:helix-turn-helix domain-containing protein n=1 Tax=Kitasatospora sp. NPDC006697 TaxID=3364020 RepID=UPI00369E144C